MSQILLINTKWSHDAIISWTHRIWPLHRSSCRFKSMSDAIHGKLNDTFFLLGIKKRQDQRRNETEEQRRGRRGAWVRGRRTCVEEEAHACAWPWSKCPAPPRRGGPALPNTSLGAMDEARGGAEQQLPDGGVQVHRLECHGSASF